MDPVTIGIGAGIFLASLAWRWIRARRPEWARRLDEYESRVKSVAGDAFRAVELLAGATGWGSAQKLAEYKRRVQRWTDRHGIPRGLDDLDEQLERWAHQWAVERKAGLDAQLDEAEKILRSAYERNKDVLDRYASP